jgi:large subunit ribosomal protein L4
MATATYTKAGIKATTPAKLDKAVFGVEVSNHVLLKAAYEAYLANGRANLAVTKTRGQVRGGGKKPWRQKGTGRARFGSSRVPIWRGGGITFGPTGQENYSRKLTTKARRQAVRQALSLAASTGKVVVIEDIVSKTAKTTDLAKLLSKIGAEQNVLIVVENKEPSLMRAARNLPSVIVVSAGYVNVHDALNADCIVFSQPALKATTAWLSASTSKVSLSKETK